MSVDLFPTQTLRMFSQGVTAFVFFFHELRRHWFTHRIASVWNSLPNSVVSAESVNSFKSRLDKFLSMHDFVYDYRASPLAAGSV